MERADLPEGCPNWVRVFVIDQVPAGKMRAGHAHRRCHQVFLMLKGTCLAHVETPSGEQHTQELSAQRPVGMWVPPWRWVQLTEWSADAVLMVLASVPYDYPAEYIEDRAEFEAGVEVGP